MTDATRTVGSPSRRRSSSICSIPSAPTTRRGWRRSRGCEPGWRPRWPRACLTRPNPRRGGAGRSPTARSTRRGPNSPPWCAEPATAVRTNRCSTCRWLPPPTPVPSFTAANSRLVPTDECWPGRTTSSATSGTAFGSAICRPVPTCPVSSRGPSREAGGARTRRRICICAPTLSIDRTRCGRTRWAPIPRPTYCSSRSPTSGSRSASTSPARGHGS